MPFTQAQATDQYVFDSFVQFLDRTVKAAYDPIAAASASASEKFPTALLLLNGSPDDPTIVLNPPVIAVDTMTASGHGTAYGIGDLTKWRNLIFVLYCFPSLRQDGQPSKPAAMTLSTCVKNAFGTENFRLLDYSNPNLSPTNLIYCTQDVVQITNVTAPMPRNLKTQIAAEKHRFDVHVSVRYPVIESIAN